jgi:radical SAM protein with 4Fe4S-binding SPASM domain
MNNNKTFCMAPWTHMNIGPNGDVYPCCMMPVTDTEGIDEDIRKQNDEINIELVDDDLQETIKAIEKTIGDELLDPLKVVSTEVHGTP